MALSPRRPKQADLRRAVSASYYAVFHALCRSNADSLAGKGSSRPERAWHQTYRATDHGQASKRCKAARGRGFPVEILSFADAFVVLQEHRHRADYDPGNNFTKQEVVAIAGQARAAVIAIDRVPIRDRRAFAIHILLSYRG